MFIRILTAMVLFYLGQCLFMKLNYQPKQIMETCWVLDTNNLTEIGMGNCISEIYYIKLGIGTPPQPFNFQIDTIRDLIWLPLQNSFISNQSQTFSISDKKTATYYREELITANVGSQIITIDQTNISTRSPIAWANQIKFVFQPFIGGLLGLGYSDTPNFLDSAYANDQINSSVYALQMKQQFQESIIYYNQIPEWVIGETLFVPITGMATWKVDLHSIKIGNMDYSFIASKSLILDASSGIFYLNPKLYTKIISSYFSNCIQNDHELLCLYSSNFPVFTLVLDGVDLDIEPKNYVKHHNDTFCLIMIGQTKYDNGSILVGSVLMTNYIVTFDKGQGVIGFNGRQNWYWQTVFYICEYVMIGVVALLLGLGFYNLWDIRVKKSNKQAVKTTKKKKGKKYQKPQISLTFLQY